MSDQAQTQTQTARFTRTQADRLARIAARMKARELPEGRIIALYENAPSHPSLFRSFASGAEAALAGLAAK